MIYVTHNLRIDDMGIESGYILGTGKDIHKIPLPEFNAYYAERAFTFLKVNWLPLKGLSSKHHISGAM